MNKILALDLDGVLNSDKYLRQTCLQDSESCILEPSKVKIIKLILESDKDIKIIMNSSWNATFSLAQFKNLFTELDSGFPVDRIIDVTSSDLNKPLSLKLWLKRHDSFSFLCIDDDTLFDLEDPFHEYQLKTSFYIGLKEEHAPIIIEALNIPFDKSLI